MPGLTIITLICVAILLTLGTWQYKRLYWKADLLAQIEQAASAAPLTDLAQANDILRAGEPLDFRRIELDGTFMAPTENGGQPFHLMRSDGKRFYWRLYQPYKVGEASVYVATHEFSDVRKASPPPTNIGRVPVIGYVRMVQAANKFTPKSVPETNRWFAFNATPELLNWADVVDGEDIQTNYFIDQVTGVTSAGVLPVRIPDIPNNHLDYMLTWYSFVIILLVIYFLLHKRTGRISRERK